MDPVSTPFGFSSTAAEVLAGVDLGGRRAVVTGGASGIGIETARALASAGARVTLAVRDVGAAGPVADQLRRTTGSAGVDVAPLDLADLASVATFSSGWREPLHVLVNNAGVMATPEQHTGPGWELQLATNHVGHFAVALGLHDALAAEGARVVSVSSSAHLMSPVVLDDLGFRFRPYDPWLAYAQSKTANILFAVEAARRWQADGIAVNAVHPGAVATGLQRHVGGLRTPPDLAKTPEQGAATSVLLAASPLVAGVTGRYFVDCEEAALVDRRDPEDLTGRGVAPYALDPANAERLWDATLRLLDEAVS
jgi:NAD(P)-dependent dehydrogenase (short-subunit alcohol dehydrogenase family)